jgi:Cu2+-exporting ATPase
VESFSEHPIARGIVSAVNGLYSTEHFRALPGKGAEAKINSKKVQVVSPGYVREQKLQFDSNAIESLMAQGKTVVFIIVDDKLVGAIGLADILRPESKEAIKGLRRLGIHTIMLTGDNPNVAKWVSEQISIDEYIAEVLPDQKSDKIKEIQSRGINVAMVGDGVNDAPALATADIGIAIGAGADVAAETADIILVKSNPLDVLGLIRLAKSTYRKMIQNLLWATGYNAIAIPLAAGIFAGMGIILSPAMGAVLMSASTVIVAINSKLLKME